jgi:hypothetical protein
MIKRAILSLIFLLLLISLFAGEIRFSGGQKEIQLFNSGNGKILNYIAVESGDKVDFQAIGVDSLIIYSRIMSGEGSNYNYIVNLAGTEKEVTRTSRTSSVTKTLAGETVSAYNSFKLEIDGNKSITIKNNWENAILFKIVASKNERDFNNYEYIRFSPQFYENEITVDISGKLYTYYQVDESNLAFDLEGPVLVKIISRLIYNDNFQNHKGYTFTVFDNGKELASFEEEAQRSGKAFFPQMLDKTPSTGDVNIIQLPAGKHHIDIKDGIMNRDMIFRFYINKTSIGITE